MGNLLSEASTFIRRFMCTLIRSSLGDYSHIRNIRNRCQRLSSESIGGHSLQVLELLNTGFLHYEEKSTSMPNGANF